MGNILLKEYNRKIEDISFELEFLSSFTIIKGKSGAGKTFLFNAIQNDSMIGKNDFVCISYIDKANKTVKNKLNVENKVIIIDNSTVVLDSNDLLKIATDTKNQYIIFSHSTYGMFPSLKSLAELVIENNQGYLRYPEFEEYKKRRSEKDILDLKILITEKLKSAWNISYPDLSDKLKKYRILEYIDVSYDYFNSMGIKGIIEDIEEYIQEQDDYMARKAKLENDAFFVAENLAFVFEKNHEYIMAVYDISSDEYSTFYLKDKKFLLHKSTMSQLSLYKSMLYTERNNDFFLRELDKWESQD